MRFRLSRGGRDEPDSDRIQVRLPSSVDTGSVDTPPGRWWRPREFWQNLRFLWRTSLPFRTTVIAVTLTSITVIAVALVMSNTIARDLFTSRSQDVQLEAQRAASVAQATLESGGESDELAISTLRQDAIDAAMAQAPNALGWAFYRVPDQSTTSVIQDIASEGVERNLTSDELRAAVRAEPDSLHYQSVELQDANGQIQPGIVIGRVVTVPSAGNYEFYLVYSLQSSQDTLDFVQRTLAISMAILVLLVGLIIGSIMRAVMQPVRLAAQTSRLLAAGQLEERIPEKGEDDIGTLARSFNHMADNLQHQIEQLENLSKVQQRFVSDVSHELRTPLTTIRLASGLVYSRKDEFDPTFSRAAELLHDQVERFELLLADLLEISRYDAGAVELMRKEHDLKALAEDVIAAMLPVAIEHGEALVLRAPERPVLAHFDDRRINRIVRNLIANAIEHGEGRPIVVTVDSNATAVALTVRDYGVGMTEEQQSNVFERFWRADPSRKRTMGGSGLGMAIAKDDAHLHHGLLEVWSAPKLGTNFRLTLPVDADEPIVSSPLPLLPEDAGAETYTREHRGEKVEGFSNEDVTTQPITMPVTLPGLEAGLSAADDDAEGDDAGKEGAK